MPNSKNPIVVCRHGTKHSAVTIQEVLASGCKHQLKYHGQRRAQCQRCETWFWGAYLCVVEDVYGTK